MDANQHSAIIGITLEHNDAAIRELYFDQFQELKEMLHITLAEAWEWQLHATIANHKVISRIYKELPGVSVFNKDHWPDLISFFKPRIIALDQFWNEARDSFEALQ